MEDGSEKINQCLDYCNLQRLTNDEIKFLDEYCLVSYMPIYNLTKFKHNLDI